MVFADKKEIAILVDQYAQSINRADSDLAATVWSTTEDVAFIHPKGDDRGWDNVTKEFYFKMMRDNFSERNLKVYNLDIACYEGMAIAIFYWEFNATRRNDGTHQHTEGRETQVFRHDGERWCLTPIHYSNMAVLGEREGF